MLGPTHLIFGLAMGVVSGFPLIPFAIGSVIPDIDTLLTFSFPFMHRGIVHTPLFLGIIAALVYFATRRKDVVFAFSLGFISHLFIDTINPTGIMWAYPLETYFTLNMATYSNVIANIGIITWSLLIIYFYKYKWRQFHGPGDV
jgi:inner membrane protein